jgi:serine phosphatase RsbU (regulator of sigma subunit)
MGCFCMLAESRGVAGNAGGDFFGFQLLTPQHLSLVIGDACGRGQQAARLLRGVFPRLERLSHSAARPSQLLRLLNRVLVREMPSDRFVTGAALDLDARTGVLTVASAGHVPGMLRKRKGGVVAVGHASGPPLGLFKHSHYRDDSYRIGGGDLVVFMTDGLLEAVETDLERLPTLTRLVASAPAGGKGVQQRLLAAFEQNQNSRCMKDDVTLLSLEVLATNALTSSRSLKLAALH